MNTGSVQPKFAVLYVDDEEQALKYFRKGLEKEFRVLIATGVDQAIEILTREGDSIGVLMTDQRMPGKTGVELLTWARQNRPGIVRLLITAYSDIESAMKAVNDGAIYKYITKPAGFDDLRQTLTAAMNLFTSQKERAALLEEKVGTLQRLMVADRVRSLAALASGISHHVRNSMTVMNCFLEEATSGPCSGNELLALAKEERARLLEIVQKVGQSVIEPNLQLGGDADLEQLIRKGVEAAAADTGRREVVVQPPSVPLTLKVDQELIVRLFGTLLKYAVRLSRGDGRLVLRAEGDVPVWNVAGARIFITAEGPDWLEQDVAALFTPFTFPSSDPSDLGLEMLMAFFVAYHHGGDLIAHRSAPLGPGFELRLAVDPTQARRPEFPEHLLEKLQGGAPAVIAPAA